MKINWDYAIGVIAGAALMKSLEIIYNSGVKKGVENAKNAIEFAMEIQESSEDKDVEALD